MADETSRPAQLWDKLQEAASAGDLQRLKDAMAQWDDEGDIEPNMAERFADVERQLALQRLLSASAREGHVDVASYLVSECRCVVKAPAVRSAVWYKRWPVMELFLDCGWWDMNRPIAGGNTLPILREVLPSEEHVRGCLEHGADPMARSKGGNNYILDKAGSCLVSVPVLRLLRDVGGADFTRSDVLHRAVRAVIRPVASEEARERRAGKLVGVVAYLVGEARYPVNQLEYAYDAALFEMWRGDKLLGTALHCAAKEKCITAVRCLLEHGADKDAKDTGGRTAAEVAEEVGFEEGAAALR